MIYVRVSYADQVDGTSLESQERDCRRYCAENDIEVVEVFVERGRSAKTKERPELYRLLSFCGKKRSKIDVLVVHKLDRLARNSDDHGYLKVTLSGYGVSIISATEPISDSAEGRFMEHILKGFSQFENERRSQKSKGEMVTLVEKGYWCHKGPTGYLNSRDKENRPILIEDPEKGPLVRRAFELVADHGHTQKAALADVTAQGLVGRTGKPIPFQAFSKMLVNPLYAGRICCQQTNGRTIQAKFPALIDPDMFDRLQAIVGVNKNLPQVRDDDQYPLRNWVRCGVCERPLTASQSRGKGGKRYAYYHCYAEGCGAVRVPVTKMQEHYEELLTGISHRVSPVLKLLREIVIDWWTQKQDEITAAQVRIDKRIQKLETKKSRLIDAFLDEKLDQDTFMDKKAEIQAQICLSKCEKHDEELESLDIQAVLASAEYVLCDAWELWKRLPFEEKKRLNDLLFPEGVECTENGELRTPSTNVALEVCDMLVAGDSPMAPPRGIEPLFPG